MEKNNYTSPVIERIVFDNEISLALESIPPIGPLEGALFAPDNFINDPLF